MIYTTIFSKSSINDSRKVILANRKKCRQISIGTSKKLIYYVYKY